MICNPSCQSGICKNGTCACWSGYSGSACDTISPVKNINAYLGINIAGLAYYSTQFLFMNHFYQSSRWISQYYPGFYNSTLNYVWDTNNTINTLPNGYPSTLGADQIVGKLLLRDLNLHYPQASS
jgi:hypothetical protein